MLKKNYLKKLFFLAFFTIIISFEISADSEVELPSSKEELKELLKLKKAERTILKSKLKNNLKTDPKGEYVINDKNKDSFYAKTNQAEIDAFARLSLEIYGTGEGSKDEIENQFEDDRKKTEVENDILFKKITNYINLKEQVKTQPIDASRFSMDLKHHFAEYADNIDLSEIATTEGQIKVLEQISEKITNRIDSNNKAIEQYDPYYLIVQKYPIVKYGFFKGYDVVKVFYRHSGTEFSGAVLYRPGRNPQEENHIVVVFPGTKSGSDWYRNIQFTRDKGEFVPGETLSLHTGFVTSYKEIKDQVDSVLENWVLKYKTDPNNRGRKLRLSFTGHSKGAAMSTLAALDAAANILPTHLGARDGDYYWSVDNPNFASPRFAGKRSAAIIEKILGKYNILRFWNYWDIVPIIIAEFTDSQHVGLGFAFNTGFFEGMLKQGPILNWHNMEKYTAQSGKTFAEHRQAGIEHLENQKKADGLKKTITAAKDKIKKIKD